MNFVTNKVFINIYIDIDFDFDIDLSIFYQYLQYLSKLAFCDKA